MPAPEPGTVPFFPPLRVRGGRHGFRRAMRRRRRAVAAGLAVTAAALAVSSTQAAERTHPAAAAASTAAPAPRERGPARKVAVPVVSAPVRIADAETVRLLRPGDRVDVIASANSPSRGADEARILATGVRVTGVPQTGGVSPDSGALVVLAVPRETARVLAGAGTTSKLAVTLC
ncbi:RcpC/CpaB family pilus assembly protein [Streptomyces sp. NPDC048361]|uniref:RcpC/CpaB family pilus assembly protein n=1 Tax=Streptomyces sp. NPDC048361 TaxID=3154720 RepID=UPI0034322FB5